MKPLDDFSIHPEFLKKQGEGIQYIGFDTDNFKKIEDTLMKDGGTPANIRKATSSDLKELFIKVF
ncbi:MAG: VOC family protein [Candidatus Humimicrobiaceae bacterium]